MRIVMAFLAFAIFSLSAAAQAAKPAGCHVLEDLQGEWDWKTPPDQGFHRGTFSFRNEVNGKVVLVKVTWLLPQGKSASEELFVIQSDQKDRAQHFDDRGTTSTCAIEVSDDQCKLKTTCSAAVPPGYEFIMQSKDEIRFVVNVSSTDPKEKLVPWITAQARRKSSGDSQPANPR